MVSAHRGGWETLVDGLRLPCAGAGSGAASGEREPAGRSLARAGQETGAVAWCWEQVARAWGLWVAPAPELGWPQHPRHLLGSAV